MRVKNKVFSLMLITLFFHGYHAESSSGYFTGPVSSAMGGAGRAAVDPVESHFRNPAVVPHAPQIDMGAYYQDGYRAKQTHETTLGVSMVDNTDEIICPGAIGYLQNRRTFPGLQVNEKYIQGSLGSFVVPKLSFGLAGVYVAHDVENGKSYTQWDGILGLLYTPNSNLGLALTYSYFMNPPEDLPKILRLMPTVSLGAHYIYEDFLRLRLDVSRQEQDNVDKELIIESGIETRMPPFFVLRLGSQWNDIERRSYITAGLGFDGPRLKIDYSFQKMRGEEGYTMHGVDMRVAF